MDEEEHPRPINPDGDVESPAGDPGKHGCAMSWRDIWPEPWPEAGRFRAFYVEEEQSRRAL